MDGLAEQLHSASQFSYLTVRDCRVKLLVVPMSAKATVARHVDIAGRNCAPFVWAACERVQVGLCGVGKERLWDRFQVKVLICVEHDAVEFARQVSSGHAHKLRSVKCLDSWAVFIEDRVCDVSCGFVGREHHRREIAVSNLCGGLRVVNWDEVS